MSAYYTRYCTTHGEWDDDVDCPSEGCPTCIKQGLFKTREQLERKLAAAQAALAAERKISANLADQIYEARVTRDDAKSARATSDREILRIQNEVLRLEARIASYKMQSHSPLICKHDDGARFVSVRSDIQCPWCEIERYEAAGRDLPEEPDTKFMRAEQSDVAMTEYADKLRDAFIAQKVRADDLAKHAEALNDVLCRFLNDEHPLFVEANKAVSTYHEWQDAALKEQT